MPLNFIKLPMNSSARPSRGLPPTFSPALHLPLRIPPPGRAAASSKQRVCGGIRVLTSWVAVETRARTAAVVQFERSLFSPEQYKLKSNNITISFKGPFVFHPIPEIAECLCVFLCCTVCVCVQQAHSVFMCMWVTGSVCLVIFPLLPVTEEHCGRSPPLTVLGSLWSPLRI